MTSRTGTEKTDANYYREHVTEVVRFITQHLDDDLTLEALSQVSGFSKFHFHRLFSAHTGFSLAQFVRLTRLKFASYQLAFDRDRSVLEVALAAGFEGPEAFARAFRDVHGQSPSDFRRAPGWRARSIDQTLPTPIGENIMKPTVTHFQETRIAVLEHRGPPSALMTSVMRFVEWRKSCADSPEAKSRTFGIVYSDPDATLPEDFRFDISGELKAALSPNAHNIVEKVIPTGRCAVLRHTGSTDAIGPTVRSLYTDFLPNSAERLRDYPLFFHYVARMPAVREHEQITDIYLPLE